MSGGFLSTEDEGEPDNGNDGDGDNGARYGVRGFGSRDSARRGDKLPLLTGEVQEILFPPGLLFSRRFGEIQNAGKGRVAEVESIASRSGLRKDSRFRRAADGFGCFPGNVADFTDRGFAQLRIQILDRGCYVRARADGGCSLGRANLLIEYVRGLLSC